MRTLSHTPHRPTVVLWPLQRRISIKGRIFRTVVPCIDWCFSRWPRQRDYRPQRTPLYASFAPPLPSSPVFSHQPPETPPPHSYQPSSGNTDKWGTHAWTRPSFVEPARTGSAGVSPAVTLMRKIMYGASWCREKRSGAGREGWIGSIS